MLGLCYSINYSLNKAQYLLDLIIINIGSICSQLIEELPGVHEVTPIRDGEPGVIMEWYQPSEVEEAFVKEQEEFEIDDENDQEFHTAMHSINIPATTLALLKYTQVLQKLTSSMGLFLKENGKNMSTFKD